MWFFTIATQVIQLYTVTLTTIMHSLCIFWDPDVQCMKQSNRLHICIYSAIFARHFLNADLVFSFSFHNSCLHRKCIFCIAQLKGCIFADLKEERKMSTYSMWVQVCYICERCIQYIPATVTLKCCGVGNSHELLSYSLFF